MLRGLRRVAPAAAVAVVLLAGCGGATLKNIVPQANPRPPLPTPPASPPPTAGQSGSVTITPQYIALAPGQSFRFSATATGGGQTEWLVNGTVGGNSTVGTVDSGGNYTAPSTLPQSENVTITVALAASAQQNYANAVASIILPGQVSCPSLTGNPQVALYSIYLPAPGKVSVQFGQTTAYGLNTWQAPTSSANGGGVQVYVAGMLGTTMYHMRAQVVLDDGATYNDTDRTCTTGTPPITTPIAMSTPNNGMPQPGIEMWNTINPPTSTPAFATDLSGRVIWTYNFQRSSSDYLQGIQLLPNGDLLVLISYLSSITTPQSASVINEIREIDLAGNTIRSLDMAALNQKLAAANMRDAEGNLYQLGSFHHSVLALPNGHWVLLATDSRKYENLPGRSGTTTVIGDALVDVDQNSNPDWAWNAFDHLDVNRHPMNFPDWTHSNDLLYSSDDHNLLLSMRHQNWVIKINFVDGTGSGDVMWRLGYQGDFTLKNATDPTDWFYAQHGMNYFTPNTTGVFRLGLMDNGNDRTFPSGQVLCIPYAPAKSQCYSTVPQLELNETNMTATMISHYMPATSQFSFFGGNAELLANGDIEADFCGPVKGAIVQELTPQTSTVVWQASTPKADQFHVNRLPSLYPGVQW